MSPIVRFYVMQIKMRKTELEDVPKKWRKKVEQELKKEEG